jgi:TDG/mug DNA glycosylase family protein
MIHSFGPIADSKCRILVLGSIPGGESLRKGQYYGHGRNGFWHVIYALFGEAYEQDYEKRTEFLLEHNIALWDVVKSCEREGSLDSHIKDPVINDFTGFFKEHPNIKHVFFNGQKAYGLFKRNIGFDFKGVSFTYFKSTSPAHAITFEEKLKDWHKVIEALKEFLEA